MLNIKLVMIKILNSLYFFVIYLLLGLYFVFFNTLYNTYLSFFLIIFWLFILWKAADYLVDWAGSVAKIYNISPIVIGLTILAFGTSAPEFFVNVLAAIKWQTDLLISNIIWSNLSNLLLILGIASIIAKWLPVNNNTLFKEIPFSFLAVLVLLFLANDYFIDGIDYKNLNFPFSDYISRIDWLVLLSFFVVFMYYVFSIAKSWDIEWLEEIKKYGLFKSIFLIFFWFLGLYLWWELIVNNAKIIATQMWISQILIWSTIVAIWTSLPELVASIVAALKKQIDMAVWNVIWSNIFNIFWIWGISSVIIPVWFDRSLNIDMFILLFSTFLIFLFVYLRKDRKITFYLGIILVFLYLFYLIYTISRW